MKTSPVTPSMIWFFGGTLLALLAEKLGDPEFGMVVFIVGCVGAYSSYQSKIVQTEETKDEKSGMTE